MLTLLAISLIEYLAANKILQSCKKTSFYTVNLEIFERILFPQIVLKHIFATLKIRDKA